jgi:DNA-binding CsgD family transcriptional regulator
MNLLENTGDFLAAIQSATDVDAIWNSLRGFGAMYGLDRVLLGATSIDPGTGSIIPTQYKTDLPSDIFRDYIESGSYRTDPMFPAAQVATQPMCLHNDVLRQIPISSEMRKLFDSELVQAWPFRVAIPVVRSSDGNSWGVVFGGLHGQKEASNVAREAVPVLWLAAAAAGLRLLQFDSLKAVSPNPLTSREKDCLLHLAQGLRVDRIAERLSISNATVEMHLANARRKLAARTSPEAVARALQAKYIVP